MNNRHIYHNSERGFALITAIMMLFAATVMGLMVMNSSEIEILLSGAQQRYESNFNVVEGASSTEAMAVGRALTIYSGETYARSYSVSDPSTHNNILSPTKSLSAAFDPGGDMDIPATEYEVDENTIPSEWPADNLLHSLSNSEDNFDYHYRVVFIGAGGSIPKGYSAEKFTNYQFQIAANRTTTIEMGGNKIGPKISL